MSFSFFHSRLVRAKVSKNRLKHFQTPVLLSMLCFHFQRGITHKLIEVSQCLENGSWSEMDNDPCQRLYIAPEREDIL